MNDTVTAVTLSPDHGALPRHRAFVAAAGAGLDGAEFERADAVLTGSARP